MGNRVSRLLPVFFAVLVFGPRLARAQAWTPPQNTLTLSGSYQLGYGTHADNLTATVIHQYFIPDVQYGITDNLAIGASLPILAVKTDASTMATFAHGPWDDGTYHSTLTDARVTVRYSIPIKFLTITPQIGASTPVQDYPVQGFAAAGRHLTAGYLGVNVGADLSDYIPRTLLHFAYEFALVQRYNDAGPSVAEFSQNYSTTTFEVDHRLGRFTLHAGLDYHNNDGGITFADFSFINPTQRSYHDAILLERILLVGGGVSYSATDHVDLFVSARIFAWGANTQNSSIFAVGASWDLGL